jgi:4-amino-4-deoxy-L-arabinose transferase-like glycosyltransferase
MMASGEHRLKVASWATLIVLLGGGLRLLSFAHDEVINPDGIVYIQQAKALHYGLFHLVTSCIPSVSVYPLLIETGYRLVGDWVLSARIISLLAGTLVLIPLYGLLRRFHDATISSLALLIFAVNPTFVGWSHSVIRDPVFWVFLVTGIYFFVLQIEGSKGRYLVLSALCFLAASWARIEAVVFILVSLCFLVFLPGKGRLKGAVLFGVPVLAFLASALSAGFILGQDFAEILRLEMVGERLFGFVQNYKGLREQLNALIENPPAEFPPYFFSYVRNLAWFIALGTLGVYVARAFFVPFFIVFLIGVGDRGVRLRRDLRLLYLSILSCVALVVLYGQILSTWFMYTRFAALFLLPSFVFVGFGLSRIADYAAVRLNAKKQTICLMLCLIVLVVSLPKSLKPKDESPKPVFKEVGEYVGRLEPLKRAVFVKGNMKEIQLVNFYANRDRESAECYLVQPSSGRFAEASDWDYLLLSSQEGDSVGLSPAQAEISLVMLKQWRIRDNRHLTLFEVRH